MGHFLDTEQFKLNKNKMKDKTTAGVLALLLGGFGIHRFYTGQTLIGVLELLFFWTFIPALEAFISGLIWLFGTEEEFNKKYN